MADTIIPPSAPTEPNKAEARMGTSSDKSWAGWAISSFTNKLAAADGQIEPTTAKKPVEVDGARSASVPPTQSLPSPKTESGKETLRPAAQPLGRSLSDRPTLAPVVSDEPQVEEGDDVFDAWGAMDEDETDVDPFTAAVASPKPTSPAPAPNKTAPVSFDDGGEPDFAGWLAAKNQAKSKNPLPKGLGKAASTNTIPTRSMSKPRVTAVPAKTIDTKPKDEDVDDGWGDAWD